MRNIVQHLHQLITFLQIATIKHTVPQLGRRTEVEAVRSAASTAAASTAGDISNAA